MFMDISSLVDKLKELQIEQDQILQQIQAISESDTNRGTVGVPAPNSMHPQNTSTGLKVGDHVTLYSQVASSAIKETLLRSQR